MTAIETIKELLIRTGTTQAELSEYADLGSKANVCKMLSRNDLKVGTFVSMLEVLGFQLVVREVDKEDTEIIVEY